jgi:hypothetical protein
MASLTEPIRMQDVVKWMVNSNFCCEEVALKADTEQTIVVGSLLMDDDDDGYILVANEEEANVTHIALENVSATGGETILALARGPALVDKDMLDFEDYVTWSEVASHLADRDILPLSEPAELEEGLS